MAQLLFDAVSANRRLRKAGFAAEQAEAVVQTVTQANNLTMQMVQDLADLKAHVTENMVTKAYLAETLSQYDLKNMVTKTHLAETLSQYNLRNMVTKTHLAETLSQYNLRNMATRDDLLGLVTRVEFDKAIEGLVTKAHFEREFARLYRNLLFGSLGCVTLIIAAIALL